MCKLLKQNVKTLKSIEFIHCKLSTSFVNCICESLSVEGVSTHGIHHFSIKMSSFLERDSFPLPVGLATFLARGRYGPFLAQIFILIGTRAASTINFSFIILHFSTCAGFLYLPIRPSFKIYLYTKYLEFYLHLLPPVLLRIS